MMAEWMDVMPAAELRDDSANLVDLDDVEIAIFSIDGVLYAIEDVCTHDGGSLADGEIAGCEIECPRHGARFDLRTGKVTAPPAYEDVDVFAVRIRDGMVQIRDERDD
jgi:3-phenylpropionate/trans-cinnamate dioxygenase ferredoxin subunit